MICFLVYSLYSRRGAYDVYNLLNYSLDVHPRVLRYGQNNKNNFINHKPTSFKYTANKVMVIQ